MRKKLLCILVLIFCLILTGCQDRQDQEEIDRIGNLINGTSDVENN